MGVHLPFIHQVMKRYLNKKTAWQSPPLNIEEVGKDKAQRNQTNSEICLPHGHRCTKSFKIMSIGYSNVHLLIEGKVVSSQLLFWKRIMSLIL